MVNIVKGRVSLKMAYRESEMVRTGSEEKGEDGPRMASVSAT